VRLSPADPILDPISVTAPHGGIVLEVPAESRFELDVAGASVDVSVPGLTLTESSAERALGRMGGGGGVVQLRAERGDVSLQPAAAKPPSEAPSRHETASDEDG
jgi:hypothetical protein